MSILYEQIKEPALLMGSVFIHSYHTLYRATNQELNSDLWNSKLHRSATVFPLPVLLSSELNIKYISNNVLKAIQTNIESETTTYLIEKDSPVILPEMGSKNASFKQQSVGGPTSYLIPTILTNSCSYSWKHQHIIFL